MTVADIIHISELFLGDITVTAARNTSKYMSMISTGGLEVDACITPRLYEKRLPDI